MTIYSWNMLYRNKRLDEAFEFIRSSEWDVFCLQEVPEAFFERLKTLPFHLASGTDAERLLPVGAEHVRLVILSKHPVETQREISYDEYWHLRPLRTRVFTRLMAHWFSPFRNRHALYADLRTAGGLVRVFNLHLVLARSAWRLEEFERAMAERDPSVHTVVCGDLNTLEKPHIAALNWLLGGHASDALFYRRERTIMEKRFFEHGLSNPLLGRKTHGLSRSQLDHILVSHELSVEQAEVVRERHGSDHHPIRAVVTLPSSNIDKE